MNVVIDIESLSLQPNAVILSIGAVAENAEKFYQELDWKSQLKTRHVDATTCMWWGNQPKDDCPLNGGWSLRESMFDLKDWLEPYGEDVVIWARGPQFDIVVLENAFREVGAPIPWNYKNIRDVRTALSLSSIPMLFEPKKKHNALYDAIADMQNLHIRGFAHYQGELA